MSKERTRRRKRKGVTHPYPGLRPFTNQETLLFFGREEQVDDVIDRMRSNHFVSVLGASGSGKSSLVRAGLVPALEGGRMAGAHPNWKKAVMRPRDRPVHFLAEALAPLIDSEGDGEGSMMGSKEMLRMVLGASSFGLKEAAIGPILKEGENLLLVVDQFEELFRFQDSKEGNDRKEEARAFVRLLLEATSDPEIPVYVVITMRSDFLGDCPHFRGLPEAINKGQYLIPRLTRNQLREAIAGPAAVFHKTYAPELLVRLLNDIGDNPDQLPILQHALMRTWDRHHRDQKEGEIRLADYEATGGLSNALNQHAEEVFNKLDSQGLGEATGQIFKCLTTSAGQGRGVRRPCRLSELSETTLLPESKIKKVIDAFRAPDCCFLMPAADRTLIPSTVVDISHESVMRIWTRLVDWVKEEYESADFLVRLSKTAVRFQEGLTGLLRDPDLQLAINWEEKTKPSEIWAKRYDLHFERTLTFLHTSQRRAVEEKEYKLLKQKREMRRIRAFAGTLGVSAIFSIMFLLLSVVQKAEADKQRASAVENAVLAEKAAVKEKEQAEIARQNEEEAKTQKLIAEENEAVAIKMEKKANTNAELAIKQERIALVNAKQARTERAAAVKERNKADSLKGLADLSAEEAKRQKVAAQKERDEANRLKEIAIANALAIQAPRYLGVDDTLAALLSNYAYNLLQKNGESLRIPALFQSLKKSLQAIHPADGDQQYNVSEARTIAWSSKTNSLAVATDLGKIFLVGNDRKKPRKIYSSGMKPKFRSMVFSPDGNYLAGGDLDGYLRVWKINDSKESLVFESQVASKKISALRFVPNEDLLLAGSSDGTIRCFQFNQGQLEPTFKDSFDSRITSLDVSDEKGYFALGTENGTLAIYRIDNPTTIRKEFDIKASHGITSLAFDADSDKLVAGMVTGQILLYDPRSKNSAWAPQSLPVGHNTQISGLSCQNGLLTSCSPDGEIKIWNLSTPDKEPLTYGPLSLPVWDISFGGGGEFIAACTRKKTYILRHDPVNIHEKLKPHLQRKLSNQEIEEYIQK